MFIKEYTVDTKHVRKSKLGAEHTYKRSQTIAVFKCDSCDSEFKRLRSRMDPKRLSNNYFHVCDNCDAKVFAQKKGIEKKKMWDLPASSNIPIGKL
jgi:hypothetical protein